MSDNNPAFYEIMSASSLEVDLQKTDYHMQTLNNTFLAVLVEEAAQCYLSLTGNRVFLRAAFPWKACQDLCLGFSGCWGIEFSGTRCEIWTRSERIAATAPLLQSVCQRPSMRQLGLDSLHAT